MSETTKQVSRGVIAIEDPNNAGEYIPFLIKVRDKEVIWSSNDNIASAGLGYLPYDNTADINKPKLTYHFTTDSGYNVEIYSNGYTIITKLFKFSEFILQTNPAYAITNSSLPIPLVANKSLSMNANVVTDIAPTGSVSNAWDFMPEIDGMNILFQMNMKCQKNMEFTNEDGTKETSVFNVYSSYSMRAFSPIYKLDYPSSSKYNNIRISVTIKGYIFQAPGIQPDTTY